MVDVHLKREPDSFVYKVIGVKPRLTKLEKTYVIFNGVYADKEENDEFNENLNRNDKVFNDALLDPFVQQEAWAPYFTKAFQCIFN